MIVYKKTDWGAYEMVVDGVVKYTIDYDSDRSVAYRWQAYSGTDILRGQVDAYKTLKDAKASLEIYA